VSWGGRRVAESKGGLVRALAGRPAGGWGALSDVPGLGGNDLNPSA